ncbi:NAD(P)H-dependent flavin oxidoreductase [Nonomuraea sp. NPDC050328]|uniref:NAD(P)H-dependent flavin oxidoreductase n=1 Tax=Nonomuraea sp. NPDC050328 TaxID=3364361 RepID=UPI0037ACFF67
MGRLQALLGIEHPIVQGPFGGGLSSVALVAAVSEAGGLGSYGGNTLGPAELTGLVAELKVATARPFAVNLWVPQSGEGTARVSEADLARLQPYYDRFGLTPPESLTIPDFAEQAEALLAAEPYVISFVMGVPPAWVLAEARRRGVVTIGTATTVEEAVALAEAGLDAVVASGADAGGHRGAFLRPVRESLVGTFSLVPQVADAVEVPVIAAGGIADRRGVRAALALGADGVQIGTGFLATEESAARPAHKQALLGPEGRVTVLTRLFSGRTARAIPNRFIRELAAHEADVPDYPLQNALMMPIRRQGDPDYLNLWSGQAAPLAVGGRAADYLAVLVEPRSTER